MHTHWYAGTHGSHWFIHSLTHTCIPFELKLFWQFAWHSYGFFIFFLFVYHYYCSASLPHTFVAYLIAQSMNRSTGLCPLRNHFNTHKYSHQLPSYKLDEWDGEKMHLAVFVLWARPRLCVLVCARMCFTLCAVILLVERIPTKTKLYCVYPKEQEEVEEEKRHKHSCTQHRHTHMHRHGPLSLLSSSSLPSPSPPPPSYYTHIVQWLTYRT